MTLRRFVWILSLLLVVLLLVPYLWPDRSPSDDANRLAHTPRAPSTDPRTLVFGLFGFEAPLDQDIWIEGRFRVSAYQTLGEMPEPPASRPRFTVSTNDLCRLRDKDCFQKTLTALPALPELLEAQAEPLARYIELHSARDFGDVLPASFTAPFPGYSALSIGNRLTLRRALFDFENGNATRAWLTIEQELAFHRRLLADSGSLIGKMIALALIEDEVRLYAALVDRNAQRPTPGSLPTTLPARLTAPERSMVKAMDGEAALIINGLARPEDRAKLAVAFGSDSSGTLFRLLPYKHHRTINQALVPSLALARDSLLPAREFLAARATAVEYMPSAWDWYINGAGAMFLAYGADFNMYLMRVHETDALLALNQVAHHLHTERVTAAQVDGVLAAMPAELRNPFDGTAAQWKDGVLRFDTGTREQKVPLQLPVTLAPSPVR